MRRFYIICFARLYFLGFLLQWKSPGVFSELLWRYPGTYLHECIKQDLRYTQKPIHFAFFTHNIWSGLLWSPAIIGFFLKITTLYGEELTQTSLALFCRCGSHRHLVERV